MNDALRDWREKLAYFQQQEVITVDPDQKFALAKKIKEAKAKIAELEAQAQNAHSTGVAPFRAERVKPVLRKEPSILFRDGMCNFIVGRAALQRGLLSISESQRSAGLKDARRQLTSAVDGLRRAVRQDYLCRALLSRAWLCFVEDDTQGARTDLNEAWQIAERGPMRLFLADIHLTRARLLGMRNGKGGADYPWGCAREDLAAAEKLINDCGYHRRDEELADAQRALLGTA